MTEAGEPIPWHLHTGDVADAYHRWPTPAAIVSDGAYGIGEGFPGDPMDVARLPQWYEPHVAAWTAAAGPRTSLWVFNHELGWATIHPLLVRYGWRYEQCNIWDKGLGHIAGRVNGSTIRHFPCVTEVCVMYSWPALLPSPGSAPLEMQHWLRAEWRRAGLALSTANEACGVANAATRKWLTADELWYPPPPEAFAALVRYANQHGDPAGRPYFDLGTDERGQPRTLDDFRYRWNYTHGWTNIWKCPPVAGAERIRGDGIRAAAGRRPGKAASTHHNQKPLALMRQIVGACTDPGDVVWEPFGGLCSASVAAVELRRVPYAAEQVPAFATLARRRLEHAALSVDEVAVAQ